MSKSADFSGIPEGGRVCEYCREPWAGDGESRVCPQCAVGSLLAMETEAFSGMGEGPGRHPALGAEVFDDVVPGVDLIRIQGSGGMGTVLKARQLSLDRDVAVKIIRADKAEDPAYEAALQEEARSMARLDHPGIVRVLDFGRTLGGSLYLLLEWVEGTTLRKLLDRRGALPAEEVAGLVLPLCAALQHAHDGCVVHRDLKPENILLTTDGLPKLADFGLARLGGRAGMVPVSGNGITGRNARAKGRRGQQETAMGTPAYMSPEQADGVALVDRRADLYALALVMLEMLTGKRPEGRITAGREVEPGMAGDKESLGQFRFLPEETPSALKAFLKRNLSGSLETRSEDASSFAAELREVFGWQEGEYGRPKHGKAGGLIGRRAWLTTGAAAAVGGLAGAWWQRRNGAQGVALVFDGKEDPLRSELLLSGLPELEKILVERGSLSLEMLPGLTRGTSQPLRPALGVAEVREMDVPRDAAWSAEVLELRLARFAESFLRIFDTDAPQSPERWMSGEVETDQDSTYFLNFGRLSVGDFSKKWLQHAKEFPHRYSVVMSRPTVKEMGGDQYDVLAGVCSRISSGNRFCKIETSVTLRIEAAPGKPFTIKKLRKSGTLFMPQNLYEVRLSLYKMAKLILQLLAPESRQLYPVFFETRHFYMGKARTRVELEELSAGHSAQLEMDRIRILNGPEVVRHTDWLHTGVFLGEVVKEVPEAGLKEGETCLVLLTMEYDKVWPNIRSLAFRPLSLVAPGPPSTLRSK